MSYKARRMLHSDCLASVFKCLLQLKLDDDVPYWFVFCKKNNSPLVNLEVRVSFGELNYMIIPKWTRSERSEIIGLLR